MILSAVSVSGSTRYWVGPACTRAEVERAQTRTREDSIVRVVQLVMVLQLVVMVQQLVMVQLVVHWCPLHPAARWLGLVSPQLAQQTSPAPQPPAHTHSCHGQRKPIFRHMVMITIVS